MTDMELLKKDIDSNDNQSIETQEIEEFLKSTENIQALGEAMSSNTSPELVQELENALKDLCMKILAQTEISENQEQILNYVTDNLGNKYPELAGNIALNYEVNAFINSQNITSEFITKVNEWNNLFGNSNPEKKTKLLTSIESKIKNIQLKYANVLATSETNPYTADDIHLIQLWANLRYGESFQINSNPKENITSLRGQAIRNLSNQTPEQKKLNTYIYTLEISNRQIIIDRRTEAKKKDVFESLLNIPNLDKKLQNIPEESQQKILSEFMDFFLQVKHEGKSFENKIGDKILEDILDDLISSEETKDLSNEEFVLQLASAQSTALRQEYGDLISPSQINELVEQSKVDFANSLKDYSSPREFFLDSAHKKMANVLQMNKENIDQHNIDKFNQSIKELERLHEEESAEAMAKKKELLAQILTSELFESLPQQTKDVVYTILKQTYTIEEIDTGHWALNEETADMLQQYTGDQTKWNYAYNGEDSNHRHKHEITTPTGEKLTLTASKKIIPGIEYINKAKNGEPLPGGGKLVLIKNEDNLREFCIAKEDGNSLNVRHIASGGYLQRSVSKLHVEDLDNAKKLLSSTKDMRDRESDVTDEYSQNEAKLDIVDQYNSSDQLSFSSNVTWEEYRRLWPNGAHDILTGILSEDYDNPNPRQPDDSDVPKDVYKINVPGCQPIVAKLNEETYSRLTTFIQNFWFIGKASKDYKVILTNYKQTQNKLSLKGVDIGNELNLSDFSLAKKDSGGNLQLFDMTNVLNAISSNNYSVLDTTTYQDNSTAILDSCTNSLSSSSQIDKSEIDNAGLSASRLINIIQCSELNQLQSSMGITGLQNEIGKLSEKMGNVSIDWKNINITQMLLNNPIQNIIHFNEYVPLKETFTKDDLKKIRDLAEEMNSMGKTIRNNRTNLQNFKTKLEEIKQSYESGGGLTNEVENMINSIYNNVSYLIEFTKPGGEMDKLSGYVLNRRNFSETTAASQVIWHWLSNNLIQMVAAIGCAVAVMCAIPSGGTSLLGVAALSTLAGMGGSRIGQRTNERLHNFKQEVVIDGKRYTIDYDNPTDVEMFLTGELGGEEFLFNIGKEFFIGTISTFGFMKAGQLLGESLSAKFPKLAEKIRPKQFAQAQSQYADDVFNQVLKTSGRNESFIQKFTSEFFEECSEETSEQACDYISQKSGIPFIGALMSIYHCITPGPNLSALSNNNVTFAGAQLNGTNIDVDVCFEPSGKIDSDTGRDMGLVEVKAYYESAGYKYNPQNNTLTKPNTEHYEKRGLTNVVHLTATKASLTTRSFASSPIGEYAGITIDHESGDCYYEPTFFADIMSMKYVYPGLAVNVDGDYNITITTEENETIKLRPSSSQDYFGGKSHKFENVSEIQARANSFTMDEIVLTINEQNKAQKIQDVRQRIIEQYKDATGQDLTLTDEQVLSIINAHQQSGVIGELTIEQLATKSRILSETISDPYVKRFLLEAGFCGKSNETVQQMISKTKVINSKTLTEIKEIIDKNDTNFFTDFSINDFGLLIRKATNIGLDSDYISKLGDMIKGQLDSKTGPAKNTLLNRIEYCCLLSKITDLKINEKASESELNQIEQRLNEIQQSIETNLSEDVTLAKELFIEVSKKKFEIYKIKGETTNAQTEVSKIKSLNEQLSDANVSNFRYKRGLLEADLLEIQLGKGGKNALNGLNRRAEELREKTETIGGRTDTETLIAKIESGILLGKTVEELQPYLDFLALAEHGAGVNILGAVIQTINTTFDSEGAKGILKEYADNVTDASIKSKNEGLKQAGIKATEIAKKYRTMKDNLNNDPNGVYENEISKRLEKFVKERPVSSISDFGNNFSHPTILLNPGAGKSSPVMSIEIGDTDYRAAQTILKDDIKVNLDGSWTDFGKLMHELNEGIDNWIRTNFSTDKLQELNSSEHRALFDYIAAKFMESRRGTGEKGDPNVSLTNLSQLLGIKGLQDCRLHAFTKQLMFDAWKRSQLENLSLEKSKPGKSKSEIAAIEQKIKIIENTKMVFVDAEFSGNVDMNDKYVSRTDKGYMVAGSQNNVIEEHTFNLIEVPVLDANGNVVTKDGKVEVKAYFADSFYHGNDGKVYDLRYTGRDTGQECGELNIYGMKGEDVYMTTTVMGTDGNPIEIKIKPLGWSVQGRGGNITGSSIETRGPSDQEVQGLNAEYETNDKIADQIRYNREAIQGRLSQQLGKLKAGENVDLTEALEVDGHEVADWQANLIKRAFELYKKVPLEQRTQAEAAIQRMINNTTTKNAIEFEQKGGATEFLQTEGVFFDAMKVFNDVYKTRIEEAASKLKSDPKNSEVMQELKNAMNEYRGILNNDMKGFSERFENQIQKEIEEKGKGRNIDGYQVYDRNNFEKMAKKFNDDMKIYIETYTTLQSLGCLDAAFELKQQLEAQYNELLSHSDKFLGHLIDFKTIKSELKGPMGRELYAKLLSIQARLTNGEGIVDVDGEIIDFDAEFGKNSPRIRELLGLKGIDENGKEFDKGWSEDSIKEAIEKFEQSGLANYYETIKLVYNPQIEQMLMEDAVYGSEEKGYYHTGNDGYVSESYNKYKDRMEANRRFEEGLIQGKTTLENVGQHLKSLIDGNPVLDNVSKGQIKSLVSKMISEFGTMFPSNIEAYKFFKATTEILIFQSMESDTRSMGDHGINHISGNISKLSNYLTAEINAGNLEGDPKKWLLMGYISHIFHDNGYAAIISRGSKNFDGSALHPFTSRLYFDTNIKPLLEGLGINTPLISQAIESHDGIGLDFSTPENRFLSHVNISDNMALGLDKVPLLQRHPKILNKVALLYQWSKSGMDLKEGINTIKESIDNDPDIPHHQKEALKSAISELNRRSFDNIDFLSIHPTGDCTILENGVRRINMYKATTFNMAAEICGIDPNTLHTLIKEARQTGDTSKLIELIKNDKFGNQIIKPLTDYKDNHVLANEHGQEYPKVPKKDKKGKVYYEYDWNIISADLLIGRRVQIQDGVKAEANETFVESKGTTVSEYVFNDTIPDHLKDGAFEYGENGIEAIKDGYITSEAREQIESVGNISNAANNLIEAVDKKKTDITQEIQGFQDAMKKIKFGSVEGEYATQLRDIMERLDNFSKTRLKGPTYSYEDIGKELGAIRKDMGGLIKFLV